MLREQQVTLIQTAIVGRKPDVDKPHLPAFSTSLNAEGVSLTITCRHGQTVQLTSGSKPGRFAAAIPSATWPQPRSCA